MPFRHCTQQCKTHSDRLEYRRDQGCSNTTWPLTHSLDNSKEGLEVNSTQEQWKPVVGYEGIYEVSDQGRVRSLGFDFIGSGGRRFRRKGKVLAGSRSLNGRISIGLSRQGEKLHSRYVHHLVLEAFLGPCPPGNECCHWNDDPSDNRLKNLRWGTRSENVHDQVRNGNHLSARKETCKSGHPLSGDNLYHFPSRHGSRVCKTCHREQRRRYARKKSTPDTVA